MDDRAPNTWLVLAMPYFCFVPTMPISYQNLYDMEKLAEDESQPIVGFRKKPRKRYTRKAAFKVVPEYEEMRKNIETYVKENRYLKVNVIYDMMDKEGLIPISKTYGEKISKLTFAWHYRQAKSNVAVYKTKIEVIQEMYTNGESVKDIATKLYTTRDYVTRQIKRMRENAETSLS